MARPKRPSALRNDDVLLIALPEWPAKRLVSIAYQSSRGDSSIFTLESGASARICHGVLCSAALKECKSYGTTGGWRSPYVGTAVGPRKRAVPFDGAGRTFRLATGFIHIRPTDTADGR